MKKTVAIISVCLVAILLIVGIFYFKPSKTLDFTGTVTEIKNDNGIYTFYIESHGTKYTVVADKNTNIKPCHKDDEPVSITDIKVGNTIDGNYKKWFAKDNQAKFITLYVENAGE